MDVVRTGTKKRKIVRRSAFGLIAALLAGGAALGVSRLQPALPQVESGSVWPDTVKRGDMLRQVHGTGSLVPQDVAWISAEIDGRIEKIYIQPGTPVQPDTVIMDLSNPTLIEATTAAEYDLKEAEAAYADLDVTLQNAKFDKQAAAAQVTSDFRQAKIKAERDRQLAAMGLIPSLDSKLSISQADVLEYRNQIEEKRLGIIDKSAEAQLAAQRVKIDQFRAMYELKKQQVDQLHVRAGVAGMLQQLGNSTVGTASGAATPLESGQNVAIGAILAKVAQQDKLKAQIHITETEAKDVLIGQPASIDTRNGIIVGKVSRIDPAAVNGTVLVDVALTGPLPSGARPDLSVDGTVDLERLTSIVYVGRPASGQPNTSITLFRVDPDGKTATRTSVKLGRASVNAIEVLGGLMEGDKVILSDMSSMDAHNRIRLN
ncbi:MAG TPA: HlyD family efflux transporter periplasmic adaptor subunit [Bryobacteraceae bacterium]|jgi:HlyD family secretion protein|nr:HlyD family efflux transporter periplasmic adaptor subunit [Bryobacteraceae bacterium]